MITARSMVPYWLSRPARKRRYTANRSRLARCSRRSSASGSGVVVGADVQVGVGVGRADFQRGGLLAALVPAGGLARLHRRHQPFRHRAARGEVGPHGRLDDRRAGQHVAGDRHVLAADMPGPGDAFGAGVLRQGRPRASRMWNWRWAPPGVRHHQVAQHHGRVAPGAQAGHRVQPRTSGSPSPGWPAPRPAPPRGMQSAPTAKKLGRDGRAQRAAVGVAHQNRPGHIAPPAPPAKCKHGIVLVGSPAHLQPAAAERKTPHERSRGHR